MKVSKMEELLSLKVYREFLWKSGVFAFSFILEDVPNFIYPFISWYLSVLNYYE